MSDRHDLNAQAELELEDFDLDQITGGDDVARLPLNGIRTNRFKTVPIESNSERVVSIGKFNKPEQALPVVAPAGGINRGHDTDPLAGGTVEGQVTVTWKAK